jgi:hypothetical protein
MTQDDEQLRLLSLFHYVVAGFAGLFSLFPIFHLVLGLFFIFAPKSFFNGNQGEPAPAFLGWFFVIFASFFIACGLTFASFILTAGRFWQSGNITCSALSWRGLSAFLCLLEPCLAFSQSLC